MRRIQVVAFFTKTKYLENKPCIFGKIKVSPNVERMDLYFNKCQVVEPTVVSSICNIFLVNLNHLLGLSIF